MTDLNSRAGPATDELTLADDMLRGADQIAKFLFGDEAERKRVYHLAATSRMPTFKLGAIVCARRSVLMDWIASQENARRAP
jgi:hypothetical protein